MPNRKEVKEMTSAELNKELKKLQHERTQILEMEEHAALFIAATNENVNDLRPEYNLLETNDRLIQLEKKIREIKHRLNVFNSTYVIDELSMTIDEVLVFLPQQKQRVDKLAQYAKHPAKQRWLDRYASRNSLVEYEYANYAQDEANRLYTEASEQLSKAQIALDRVNSTVEIA